jgi:hypothetical protein
VDHFHFHSYIFKQKSTKAFLSKLSLHWYFIQIFMTCFKFVVNHFKHIENRKGKIESKKKKEKAQTGPAQLGRPAQPDQASVGRLPHFLVYLQEHTFMAVKFFRFSSHQI